MALPTHGKLAAGVAVALAWGLVGCGGVATLAPQREDSMSVARQGAKLIDEGGPVFLQGRVVMPTYYKGEVSGLQVRAERLDGGAFPQVAPATVAGDGSFTLRGQRMSNLMFVTAEFIHEDSLHRVRASAQPDPNTPVTLDASSSLLAASVAMAAQRRKLLDLDLGQANQLLAVFRQQAGAQANGLLLNQTNEALSQHFLRLSKLDEGLLGLVQAFDLKLNPPPFPVLPPNPTPAPVEAVPGEGQLPGVK